MDFVVSKMDLSENEHMSIQSLSTYHVVQAFSSRNYFTGIAREQLITYYRTASMAIVVIHSVHLLKQKFKS